MERALRVVRPVGRITALRPNVSPSSLGLPRSCRGYGTRSASRLTRCVANQFTLDRPRQPVRYNSTTAETVSQGSGEKTEPHRSPKDSVQPQDWLVKWDSKVLTLSRRAADDSTAPPLTLSLLWLRDACRCTHCVDPDSGQKSFSTTDLPDNPAVKNASLLDSGELKVVWANDPLSGARSHTSIFSAEVVRSWLEQDTEPPYKSASKGQEPILWDRVQYEVLLSVGRCRISWKDWNYNRPAFWNAMSDLHRTGLIFVTGVPEGQGNVQRVASKIGRQQSTIYGWTWDVKSKPQAENVAYTNQFLGLHQDLMYWEPIPEVQFLHCHSNNCEGGESLFSHGLRAAYELKHAHPEHYDALTRIPSFFGYNHQGHKYARGHTTIITDRNHNPVETRWSPPFQEAFPLTSEGQSDEDLRRWKAAAAQFKAIAESPSNMFEVKLKPGDCVIFNNRKILHGRRQFNESRTGEASRWLEGVYMAPDEFRRVVRVLLGGPDDPSFREAKKAVLEAKGVTFPIKRQGWYVRDAAKKPAS